VYIRLGCNEGAYAWSVIMEGDDHGGRRVTTLKDEGIDKQPGEARQAVMDTSEI